MNRLLHTTGWTFLLNGFVHVVFGALLINLLEHYGKSYSEGGTLVMLQFLGFLAGVLTMPWWNRLLGRRKTLMFAVGAICVAEAAIGFLPPWVALYALAAFAGIGFGLAEASSGTTVLDAAGEQKASAMSNIEVYFGVGALAMPFAVAFFISKGVWTYSFFILSGLALILAVLWGRLSFRELNGVMERRASGERAPRVTYTGAEWGVLGMMIAFFFIYVGLEVCLIAFLPSVFTETYQWDNAAAALTVTGFWATMVVGRVIVSVAGSKIRYLPFLYITCGVSAVAIGIMTAGAPAWGAYAIVLLLGLLLAGIFAIALIYANELLPGRTERTSSLCIAAGGLGGSAMPAVVGVLFDRWSPQWSLALLAFSCLLMVALVAVAMQVYRGKVVLERSVFTK